MPLIVLTKSADQIPQQEILLRGEAIEYAHWTERSATDCSVVVRFASGAGNPVQIFQGPRAAVSGIYAKIKAGMQ
jgi:hypothetical protein